VARLVLTLGNRHVPVQILANRIRLQKLPAVEAIVGGARARPGMEVMAPFEPDDGGAWAWPHDHGHDHHHGHDDDHDHGARSPPTTSDFGSIKFAGVCFRLRLCFPALRSIQRDRVNGCAACRLTQPACGLDRNRDLFLQRSS